MGCKIQAEEISSIINERIENFEICIVSGGEALVCPEFSNEVLAEKTKDKRLETKSYSKYNKNKIRGKIK